MREAIVGTLWTMRHAIRTNTGGVGGRPQLMVLGQESPGKFKAAEVPESDMVEHEEALADLESHIRRWTEKLSETPAVIAPEPPAPAPPA